MQKNALVRRIGARGPMTQPEQLREGVNNVGGILQVDQEGTVMKREYQPDRCGRVTPV